MLSPRAASAALASAVTLSLAVSLGATAPSYGDPARPALPEQASDRAEEALDRVEDLAAGREPGAEPTVALRDLFLLRDQLEGEDREKADAILARPDGQSPDDSFDEMVGVRWSPSQEARPLCNAKVCVHYVRSGRHAATYGQAKATLDALARSWKREIGDMRFRAPRKDGKRGDRRWANSKGKFDVYIGELPAGYFGYAVAEPDPAATSDGKRWTATGYAVLDKDFQGFSCAPADCRRVTAAHEFFHVVQFGYDFTEPGWFLESTAAWMEERVYDGINDNRQFLPAGQLGRPRLALERYDDEGSHYGNWIFHEHYGQKHGHSRVRRAWTLAGKAGWDWRRALSRSLAAVGTTLPDAYVAFAAGNQFPAQTYAEGSAYVPAPAATVVDDFGHSGEAPSSTSHTFTPTVQPLASASARLVAAEDVGDATQVRVDVDLGAGRNRAHLVVQWDDGHLTRLRVPTDGTGIGTRTVPFDARVKSLTVTMANLETTRRPVTMSATVLQ